MIDSAYQPGVWRRLCTTAAMLVALGLATTVVAQEANQQVPAGIEIVSLEIAPANIELKNRFDYRQVLVTGVAASGERIDLTRAATYGKPEELAALSATGMLRPKANGSCKITASYAGKSVEATIAVSGLDQPFHPSFVRDVMPILAKNACNAGTCHGGQDGKNGFKLSLRGYDPLFDHQSLTDDVFGRRFNRAAPELSLMLSKPAGDVPHEGGMMLKHDDPHYQLLYDWIADGAGLDLAVTRVERIEIVPSDPQLARPGMTQQMAVLAHYADGSVRDVTAEAFVESSLGEVIEVNKGCLATAVRRGEAALLARYEGAYAATTITCMGDRSGYAWVETPEYNYIDGLVSQKLQRVKLLPSDVCTDAEFIRRLHLDLVGLPPTPEQVRAFVADTRESRVKRDALVDELVGSSQYVEHWTHKWADLLQVNRKFLGEKGVWTMRAWIKKSIADNMPYDQFVRSIVDGHGSSYSDPSAAYYKIHREPDDSVENLTQLFLGVRFNCNKCHDHPFERWTQNQYYNLAAYFAQIGRKPGRAAPGANALGVGIEGDEIVFDKNSGDVTHARTNQVSPPKFPFEHADMPAADAPRREQLAHWLTSKSNPYFAKSFVNRTWSYLLGVGIIDPVDDIRAGNPPSNAALLDKLTEEFIASNFNAQQLVKTICKSRVYQQSIQTNQWNNDDSINFSHAIARRLSAETLIDTIYNSLGVPLDYAGVPAGFSASQLPDPAVDVKGGFLGLFGRPPRESPCECERTTGVMLSQAMNLINGPAVADAIAHPNNRIAKAVNDNPSDDAKVVEELFLSILCRYPTPEETAGGVEAIKGGTDRLAGAQDLAWALLNSPAFLFNR